MSDFQPINPFGAFQQGYGIGGAIQQNVMAEQARKAEAARQAEEDRLFDILMSPRSTPQDYMNFMRVVPQDQRESIEAAYNNMSTQERQNDARWGMETYSAFQTDPEVAIRRIEDAAVAMENEGNAQGAKDMMFLAELAKKDPKAAEAALVTQSLSNPDFRGAFESTITTEGEKQRQQLELVTTGVDLGLTPDEADEFTEISKYLGHDNAMEMLQYAGKVRTKGKDLDPMDVFNMTKILRNEYVDLSSGYREAQNAYTKLQSSADASSGPGDVALIFQFMKMLDEGSVVRESEYAAARDTAGLYNELKNTYASLSRGEKLQPDQRAEYVRLAGEYMTAAENDEKKAKELISTSVKNWGLNKEEVFGPVEMETAVVEPTPETPTTDVSATATVPAEAELINLSDPRALSFAEFLLKDAKARELTTQEEWDALNNMTFEQMQRNWPGTWGRYQSTTPVGSVDSEGFEVFN